MLCAKLEFLCDSFEKLATQDRGDCVFPASKVNNKSNKDHYPINNINQARNALARASQHKSVPGWYSGSLESLVKAIQRKVHAKYPSIETTNKSKKPGPG